MAGERKGITYEALFNVALEKVQSQGAFTETIFWNVKAAGMTVTPDFTVGRNSEKPKYVFLITHSGSAKESEKKNWRNLGELAECKLRLGSVPSVYNVAFDSVVKDSLKLVGATAFDGQLVVGDRPYGDDLIRWVDGNHKSLPKSGEDKAAAIRDLIDEKDPVLFPIFKKLTLDLKKLIAKTNPQLESLWKAERRRKAGTCSQVKTTSVRRGLSKVLIFEDVDLARRLYSRRKVALNDVPQYTFDLKLAKKVIGGAVGADAEISNALRCLSRRQVDAVFSEFDTTKVLAWLTTLRNIEHISFMASFVIANRKKLANATKLFRCLQQLHGDPMALAGKDVPSNWPPQEVWLFTFLMEVLKSDKDVSNGYGYSQMEQEVSRLPGLPRAGSPIYRINLPDWSLRRNKLTLPDHVLKGIAECVSKRLAAIAPDRLEKICSSIGDDVVNNIMQTKLMCYRMFDPLKSLIADAVVNFRPCRVRACYAEAAGLAGSTAVMSIGIASKTLINWQSATDQGKDHKVKELCGRAAALRYSWDDTRKRFVTRPGVKKLFLVVDGTWTQGDLETLALAGWDQLFYPDQMNELAAAIV